MLIIGIIIAVGCVLGGFVMINGPLMVLFQPAEFVVIGGAALGAVITGTPVKVLSSLFKKLPGAIKGSPYDKAAFSELLRMQYEVYVNAKKGGLLSLESDINAPESSPLFTKYPKFIANPHAIEFFCDAMKLLVNGAAQPDELEMAMEVEIETHHEENAIFPGVLNRVADSLPGLGIVAAVLGIVIAMQHLDGPPEELGHHVAAALVGTFLGLLLSYGIVAPVAANLDSYAHEEARYFACIKAGLVAFAGGVAPATAIEFARKTIYSFNRPHISELEPQLREIKPR